MAKCYTCLKPLPDCDCNNEDEVIRLRNLLGECIPEIISRIIGLKTLKVDHPKFVEIKFKSLERNENLLKEIKQELGIKD